MPHLLLAGVTVYEWLTADAMPCSCAARPCGRQVLRILDAHAAVMRVTLDNRLPL